MATHAGSKSTITKSVLRTKVNLLVYAGKWDDQGTGHAIIEGFPTPILVVIDELSHDTLLYHDIRREDIYRKQDGKIISWRDPTLETELALSFADKMGCSYMWECIIDERRNMETFRLSTTVLFGKWAEQSLQKQMAQVTGLNGGNVASGKLDEASGSRKEDNMVRTLETEYEISREVLEQHSGKKLKDVAAVLGVSRSILKRICRRHGIFRWPPSKSKRSNHQEFVQANPRSGEESSQRQHPVSNPALEKGCISGMQATTEPDDNSIMVKATFKDDIIKFHLSVASSKIDLEKAVSMRLNLSVRSLKIKSEDEDGDWVLIACDADLRTCLTELGERTVRMLIDQLPSDDTKSDHVGQRVNDVFWEKFLQERTDLTL